MFEILLKLEPDATKGLHAIMIDNEFVEPFTAVITEIVNPTLLSILTPNEQHLRNYNNWLHSSLDNRRIDTLLYSLFKFNDIVERRLDRIKIGIHPNPQPFKMKSEGSHPDAEEKYETSYLQEQSKEDYANEIYSVTKSGSCEGSAFVMINPEIAAMCNISNCQSKCTKCHGKVRCSHLLSCTCEEFKEDSVCPHIHLMPKEEKIDDDKVPSTKITRKDITIKDKMHEILNHVPDNERVRHILSRAYDELEKALHDGKSSNMRDRCNKSFLGKMIVEGLTSLAGNPIWANLASAKIDTLLEALRSLTLDMNQREDFLDKISLAKSVWLCDGCLKYGNELIFEGFIECSICRGFYHRLCFKGHDDKCEACISLTNNHCH